MPKITLKEVSRHIAILADQLQWFEQEEIPLTLTHTQNGWKVGIEVAEIHGTADVAYVENRLASWQNPAAGTDA